MAPSVPIPAGRRALLWSTLPALAAFFGLLWFRRRRRRAPPSPPSLPCSEPAFSSVTDVAAPSSPPPSPAPAPRAARASDGLPADEDRRCSPPPLHLQVEEKLLVALEREVLQAVSPARDAPVAPTSPPAEQCPSSSISVPESPVAAEALPPPTPPPSPASPPKAAGQDAPRQPGTTQEGRPAPKPAVREDGVGPARQVSESSRVKEEVFSQTTTEEYSPELPPSEESSSSCSSGISDRLGSSQLEVSETVACADRVPSEVGSEEVQIKVCGSQEFVGNHRLTQESEEVINRKVIEEEECAKTITEEVQIVCEKQEVALKSVVDCCTEIPESTVSSSSIEQQRLLPIQSGDIAQTKEGERHKESHTVESYSSCIETSPEELKEVFVDSSNLRQYKEEAINKAGVDTNTALEAEKVVEEDQARLSNTKIDFHQEEPEIELTSSLELSSRHIQETHTLLQQEESKDSHLNQEKVINIIGVEDIQNSVHTTPVDPVEVPIASSNKSEDSNSNNSELAIAGSEETLQEVTCSVEDSRIVLKSKEDSEVVSSAVFSDRDSCDRVPSYQIPNHIVADIKVLECFTEDNKYLKNSALKERNTEAKEVTASVEQLTVKKSSEAEKENTSSSKLPDEKTIDSEGVVEVSSMKTRGDSNKSVVRPAKASDSASSESTVTSPAKEATELQNSPKSAKKSKSVKSKKTGESSKKSKSPESSMKSQSPKSSEESVNSTEEPMKVITSAEESQEVIKSVEAPKKVIKSVESPKKVIKSVESPKKVNKSVEETKKVNKVAEEAKKDTGSCAESSTNTELPEKSTEAIDSCEKSKKVINSTEDSMKVNNSSQESKKVASTPESSKKTKKTKKSRNSPEKVPEPAVTKKNTRSDKEPSSETPERNVQSNTNVAVDAKVDSKETPREETPVIKTEAVKEVEVSRKAQKEAHSPPPAASTQKSAKGKKVPNGPRSKSKESSAAEQQSSETKEVAAAAAAEAETTEQLTKAEADELARLIQRQLTGTKSYAADATSAPSETKSETSATTMEVLRVDAPSFEMSVGAASPAPASDLKSADAPTTADASSTVHHHHHHHHHHQQQRDSANHSPAEGMLASPRACYSEDAASEDSSDSGKGCSDAPTPPSRTPASGSSVSGDGAASSHAAAGDAEAHGEASATAAAAGANPAAVARVYEFVLPQHLVGRLIGRHGCYVHQIKARTNASIFIKRHPDTTRLKICAVEGSPADVDSALEMIRQKFPEKRYPNVSLEQVCFVPASLPVVPVLPECLRLQLVEGVTNDVTISSLVTPAHFFVQQPTHPTFPSLAQLGAIMDYTYNDEVKNTSEPPPPVPTVQSGIIVVTPSMGSWFRAEVVSADTEAETCQIRYVDYGGYDIQSNSALRQIRTDFMTLPFQATECYLANIACKNEEEGWTAEAMSLMEQMTAGQVIQAQVCGYSEDGIPAVSLYAVIGSQVVSIGDELVARGFAQWWEPAEG